MNSKNWPNFSICLIAFLVAISCKSGKARFKQAEKYRTRNYVEVGKMLPSVPPPYVIDLRNGAKHLVFIGCNHIRDTTDQQFAIIQKYFNQLKPQVTFNEGGPVTNSIPFRSLNDAISRQGETGCLKYLTDQAGITMLNGDLQPAEEFALTLKKHPKDKLFLYYVMERFVIPHLYGADGNKTFEQVYQEQIPDYFVAKGFPLAREEQDITYFQKLYQQYMGIPFKTELNDKIEQFDYLNPNCDFCEIGRTSKMVRDSVLLSKIDRALDSHDRVLVTFGQGHALAIEPALHQLIKRNVK